MRRVFSGAPAFDVIFASRVPLTSEAVLAEARPLLETNGDGESLLSGAVPKPNLMIQMTGGRT